MWSRSGLAALGMVAVLVLGTSCGNVDTSGVTAVAAPVEKASLGVGDERLVGVGEATHGNAEFVRVRLAVIKNLVREHGFRTVALEADYGGTAAADDYVAGGEGTAEQAADALGFDVYRTQETAALLRWIHDHNADRPASDRVRLFGFDMQRYDHNKARLLRYLTDVDPGRVRAVERSLADLSDATRASQDEARTAAGAKAAGRLVTSMRSKRSAYVDKSSGPAYVRALHYAETIRRGAQLQLAGNDYAKKRDRWMADNVRWIRGVADRDAKVIVAGHNGHIEKTGAAFAFPSMGELLAKWYGDDYFTIGTEFGTSTFVSKDNGSGERRTFTVSHDTPLAALFGDEPLGYVAVARASEQPENERLLATELRMGSIGDSFGSLSAHLSWTYTVSMVPSRAYDGLVYVPRATPVTPL